jgi:hypothetical protein
LERIQEKLDLELSIPEIAHEFGLKADTLRKAVYAGKLHKAQKKSRASAKSFNRDKL